MGSLWWLSIQCSFNWLMSGLLRLLLLSPICLACTTAKLLQCLPLGKIPTIVSHHYPIRKWWCSERFFWLLVISKSTIASLPPNVQRDSFGLLAFSHSKAYYCSMRKKKSFQSLLYDDVLKRKFLMLFLIHIRAQ